MITHGTTDERTTWCGIWIEDTPRSTHQDEVNCLPCLHAALNQSCAICKVRKKVGMEDHPDLPCAWCGESGTCEWCEAQNQDPDKDAWAV